MRSGSFFGRLSTEINEPNPLFAALNAREGVRDDLVLAVALAVFGLSYQPMILKSSPEFLTLATNIFDSPNPNGKSWFVGSLSMK